MTWVRRLLPHGALSLFLAANLPAQTPPIPQGLLTGQAARFVVGQTNFSDISFGVSPERFGAISGIAIVGNKLIVADSSYLAPPNNNRVLIFNDLAALKQRLPQDPLLAADVVLGQPDFTTSTSGASSQKMFQPVGVASDGVRLFVADWGNNRVLLYNTIPETSGAPADVVVGQANFDASDFGTSAQKLRRPNSVSSDGTRLLITDTLNNRVLLYNRIPSQNGASADLVLGQPGFDTRTAGAPSASSLSSPMSATTDGQRLIITDLGNNRVLIYNTFPAQSGAPADVVVGQPDFTSNSAGNTATTLNFPRFAYSDGARLLIADSGNNRILIYNQIPTQNGAAPDLVLGQTDFLGLTESCAASNLAVPFAVASDGEALLVSDAFNRRVLGFERGSPALAIKGIVNGASFSPEPQTRACDVLLAQPPLAPGAIASLFGTDLADATAQADSLPLPTELAGVRVKFNGLEAPLFYVSPAQINVQVPFGLTGFSASVEVEKRSAGGTLVSTATAVGLANGAPGIFAWDASGSGRGVVVHADFSPVTEDSPARPGETLVAFVTGLGTVDHPITEGEAAEFGASGAIVISGVASEGQTITITINDIPHSYTTVSGDNLDTVITKLVELINNEDPNVTATADLVDFKVKLRARVFGDQGANITYSASVSEGGALVADSDASNVVPGGVTLRGEPGPGQTVTILLQDTVYAYTTVAGDTLETILSNLADLVNTDPNVSATANLATLRIQLDLRDPAQALNITYDAFVSEGATLTTLTDRQHLLPGVANAINTVSAFIGRPLPLVPGEVLLGGTPEPGQTLTITLQEETTYSYTTKDGDTLQTVVTALADLINSDPNVSATADVTNLRITLQLKTAAQSQQITFRASLSPGATLIAVVRSNQTSGADPAAVSFAGLAKGFAGLYQVNFTIPPGVRPNPNASLTLSQNLIVFGSVTNTDIFSNSVTFPIGE